MPGGENIAQPPTKEQLTSPTAPERHKSHEASPIGPSGDQAAVAAAVLPALPTLPQATDDETTTHAKVTNSNPSAAADDELIEKEWVEKAKKVISETKHDPYLQEREVSKLQADYLQKRYGKTVNMPSDG